MRYLRQSNPYYEQQTITERNYIVMRVLIFLIP